MVEDDAAVEDEEMEDEPSEHLVSEEEEEAASASVDGCPLDEEEANVNEELSACPFKSPHPEVAYYNSEQLAQTYRRLERLEALNEKMKATKERIADMKQFLVMITYIYVYSFT